MSGFILPDDIWKNAEVAARNIADAWHMLANICLVKQYPFDLAESKVGYHINSAQMSEVEAIHKVYHEVAYS
jgi:hypothetical protein